jgi:hypothetical protein
MCDNKCINVYGICLTDVKCKEVKVELSLALD